jgi:lipopolysaccharide export system permease protein
LRLTLFKYISREIWSVFIVSLLVFSFIAMAANIMNIMDFLVNQGFTLAQVMTMIVCMFPQVILFSLPAACLMSVMLAFVRLASDNEIIALHASGVSLFQLMPPVFFFSVACGLIAGFMTLYGVPWGNRTSKDYELGIIKSKTNLTIKERVFNEPIDGLCFYVNSYSTRDKEMNDVFVVDRRDEKTTNTIVAEKGMIVTGRSSNTIDILFRNATIFSDEKGVKNTRRTIKLPEEFSMSVDLGDVASKIASREKKPKEMYFRELLSGLKDYEVKASKRIEMGVQLYEMFSIPIAIFVLGIIGAALGSHVKARGRTTGIMISLIVFLIYYTSLMGSQYLCELGIVAPYIGVWVPVLLLLGISLFFHLEIKRFGAFRFIY